MDPLYTVLGIKSTNVLAALAGGIVRAFLTGGGLLQSTTVIVVGMITASAMSPVVIAYINGTMLEPAEFSVVFLVGLSGMFVCEGVLRLARSWSRNPTIPPVR